MWGIEFSRPEFLWLLLLIPLLIGAHFFFLKRTQTKALNFANFEAIKRISGQRLVTKNITVLILRLFVFLALIAAISGMTFWYDGLQNEFDYVVAIDTSSSMVNDDITPTRLDAAKEASISFLDNIDTAASFGLVSFSGVTRIHEPLTSRTLPLRTSISTLNISRSSGTDISGAIITAANLFYDAEGDRGNSILLVTDGVDTVGAYVDDSVKHAVEYARERNVVINPVGIGTEDAPVGYLPESLNLTTSMDRKTLQYIADETGGEVAFPSDSQELESHFSGFDTGAKNARIPIDMQNYGLIVATFFLFIEWVLINLVFRRVV